MGTFKLRPVENRRIGYVGDTDLWPDDRQDTANDPFNALMARMDRIENTLSRMSPEGRMGQSEGHDKLMQKVEELVGEALDVAMNPPDTWKPHLERKDKIGLVDMEYKELQNALKSRPKDVHKEAVHTMAALMRSCL